MAESNWKSDGYVPDKHGFWKATLDDRADFGYPVGYYYADTLRAVMIAVGNFFNDMYVIRYDENGYPRKRIQIPFKFGPRAKSHDFRREQESGQEYVIPLPNMYYKITSFQYDNLRAASSNAIRTWYEDYLMKKGVEERAVQLLWSDTQPVPYNVGIEITAKADKLSDLFQIIEQITSRFNPDAFVFIKEFWFMNIRRDVKMKLDSVDLSYQDEEPGEQAKREVEAKFTITIETCMYTKIMDGAIIDQIIATLNPSIAVFRSETAEFTLSGTSGENPEFYLDKTAALKHPLYTNGIIQEVGAFKDDPNLGVYEPTEGHEHEFFSNSPGYWTFTSAWTAEHADKYKSVIGISGNYKGDPDTYDKDSRSYQGSLTDRYDFARLSKDEDAYTNSGRRDFLNSDNEKIEAYWFSNHESEIAP